MNLYLRLLMALAYGLCCGRVPHDETVSRRFRVWPHDIDAFGHMNNGRYLQIMDVARVAWMTRVGVIQRMWQRRWGAVLGGGLVRFRHSLEAFAQYRVDTRLIGWDATWWFLEHVFVDGRGRRVAVGISRAALRRGSGWVATEDVVGDVVPGAVSPELPDYVEKWLAVEEAAWRSAAGRGSPPPEGAVEDASVIHPGGIR